MKWIQTVMGRALILSLFFTLNSSRAQSGYTVTERGTDYKVLQKVTVENGTNHVHRYTELATGLNYTNAYGQLVESKEQIDILPSGGAAAVEGQHKVYFPANIYNGVLEVVTPDGKHLRSRPLGVSYDDGSNTVFIATLKSAIGYLVSSNKVVYRDAFTGFKADLVCTYRRGGFECDLVFRQQPPAPGDYGLDPDASTLQMVTEFFNTQDPEQIPGATDEWYGLQDSTLKFGRLTMTQGRAFTADSSGTNSTSSIPRIAGEIPVYKRWLHLDNRTFLVEEVPLEYLADDLDALPLTASANSANPRHNGLTPKSQTLFASGHWQLPPSREFVADTNQMLTASIDLNHEPGVVLDYVAINSFQTSFTFAADTTYLIDGSIGLNGTNTIQAGAVIKFNDDTSTYNQLLFFEKLVCETTSDHPAIFTSMDDDTVGQPIDGSTGIPITLNNSTYFIWDSHSITNLQSLRFKYALNAVGLVWVGSDITLQDCQFEHCLISLADQNPYYYNAHLKNTLFSDTACVLACQEGGISVWCENVTVNAINFMWFNYSDYSPYFEYLSPANRICLTNSVVICSPSSFWASSFSTNSSVINPSGTIFQSAANANYYLAANSPYRDIGTTNIDPDLLTELQTLTTYAPQDGGMPDTNTPDLGYHYPVNEDSDHDGLPDWWEWKYFGNYSISGTNLDTSGNTLLSDYQSGANPNILEFSVEVTNNYVTSMSVPVQLNVFGGVPSYLAVTVDDTNYETDAAWTAYTSSNLTVNLGMASGWHDVWIGLRGHADDTNGAAWQFKRLKLNFMSPLLVITNPVATTLSVPLVQIKGYSPNALASVSYDISNAVGVVSNQDGGITDTHYDTSTWEFTTTSFEAVDVPLEVGLNTITLRAKDKAGNVTTTNINLTLDYSTRTNPPAINLFWPKDGEKISGSTFNWRGWVDDPMATVSAQMVGADGTTNKLNGLVERNGNFWVENLPMPNGTNSLMLTVTDSAGNIATTNITVSTCPFTVTMTPIPDNQLWYKKVTATGTISDSTQSLWINGVKASVASGEWTATNVPMTEGGTAIFNITCYESGEAQPDGSHGN